MGFVQGYLVTLDSSEVIAIRPTRPDGPSTHPLPGCPSRKIASALRAWAGEPVSMGGPNTACQWGNEDFFLQRLGKGFMLLVELVFRRCSFLRGT